MIINKSLFITSLMAFSMLLASCGVNDSDGDKNGYNALKSANNYTQYVSKHATKYSQIITSKPKTVYMDYVRPAMTYPNPAKSVGSKQEMNQIMRLAGSNSRSINENRLASIELQPLQIILLKKGCIDCEKAEKTIVKEFVSESKENSEYKVIVIDLAEGVPTWLKSIPNVSDSQGRYFTPTVINVSLIPTQTGWEWATISRSSGTNNKSLTNAIHYKKSEEYKNFIKWRPNIIERSANSVVQFKQ